MKDTVTCPIQRILDLSAKQTTRPIYYILATVPHHYPSLPIVTHSYPSLPIVTHRYPSLPTATVTCVTSVTDSYKKRFKLFKN